MGGHLTVILFIHIAIKHRKDRQNDLLWENGTKTTVGIFHLLIINR